VSLPASLRKLDVAVFGGTPLAALDLRASANVTVGGHRNDCLEVTELGLPAEGFGALCAGLLPGSHIELLYADIDTADVEHVLERLDEWAIDRLRVVSPRFREPFEWVGIARPRGVAVSDPVNLTAPSAVTLTVWRQIPDDQRRFVRSIDLSAIGPLPMCENLSGSYFLESVILPRRLRVLPARFFEHCPRLSHVGTTACVALDEIGYDAFKGCRSLREFVFPSMTRVVGRAFGGASITCLDLSETRAESIEAQSMKFLERMMLPRRCILTSACGLPALRCVILGACGGCCSENPRQVRFESLAAPAKGGPLALGTCVFAAVACLLGRESFPFPP
jgi:hypothetical protein